MDGPSLPKYLLTLGVVFAVLTVPMAVFNVRTDPFSVFAQLKSGPQTILADTSMRMAKPYAMRAYRPDCLILGNSRADVGYRAAAMPDCQRAYNAGVSAGRIYEVRRHLQHAIALGQVRHVLLAVDFEMFASPEPSLPGFSEQRLAVDAKGRVNAYPASELVGLAVGLEATKRSLQLRGQKPQAPMVLIDGDRNPESVRQWVFANNSDLGERLKEQLKYVGGLLLADPPFDIHQGRGATTLAEYQNILKICAENGISLRVVINPVHVVLHDYMRLLGVQPAYLEWRQQLAATTAAVAATQDVQLWDFGKINALTTEAVDLHQSVEGTMKGYWEPSHFRASLGDRVIQQIYAGRSSGVENFGQRLTAAKTGDDAAYVRAVSAWADANPEVAAFVEGVAKAAIETHNESAQAK